MRVSKVKDCAGNIYYLDSKTIGAVQKLSAYNYNKKHSEILFFKTYGKALTHLEENKHLKKVLISNCMNIGEGNRKNRFTYHLKR